MSEDNKQKVIDAGERWEKGIAHLPLSNRIVRDIAEIDFKHNADYFCWKVGGDGDNGEALMYLLDIYFDGVGEDILTAVNNHTQLLEALKFIVSKADAVLRSHTCLDHGPNLCSDRMNLMEEMNKANKAIANAEAPNE